MAKLSRSEQEEKNFERFINHYKYKDKGEIISSLLEIKASSISEFEYRLQDAIRSGDLKNYSIGSLSQMKRILSTLNSNNTPAKEFLNDVLKRVELALEKK